MIKNATWDELKWLDKISEAEVIKFITRQHPIIIIIRLVSLFLVMVLLWAVNSVIFNGSNDLFTASMYMLDVLIVLFMAFSFHNYYLSMQILTNERLIDIDQTGIVKRQVNEVGIENIQNLNYDQRGVAAVIFNYGDVIAETAGTNIDHRTNGFVFEKVYQPKDVMSQVTNIWHGKTSGHHDHMK